MARSGRDGYEELRARAETALAGAEPAPWVGDVRALLHELQVRQAELDIQNEEIRRVHGALEHARQRYHDLFEWAPVCYLVASSQNFLVEANADAERILGRPRALIVGQPVVHVAVPGDQVRLFELISRARTGGTVATGELRLRRGRDEQFHARIECRPLEATTRTAQVLVGVVDITELRSAVDQARLREDRWRRLFEASRDAQFVVDGGKVVEANGSAAKLLERVTTELVGRPVEEFFRPEYREALLQLVRVGPRAARPSQKLALTGPRAAVIPVQASVAPVDGTASLVLLTMRDLRAELAAEASRKRVDEELARLQRLQALGRMAGAVAHEINNVLAVVTTVASLAKELHGESPAAPDFAQILAAGERGRELTQRLLGFVRSAPGRREPLLVETVLQEAATLVRRLAGVGVTVDVEPRAPDVRVLGDATQLHQAILNLSLNSIDAIGGQGRIVLRARLAPPDPLADAEPGRADGPHVRLEVEDSGPGFSPEALSHAFEPFFSTKGGNGNGFGLASVWSAAHDHGGTAFVDTQSSPGARVVLLLPVETRAPAATPAPARPKSPPATGLSALVLDDEKVLRLTCSRLFERMGWKTVVASDGREARAAVEKGDVRFALALVDLSLPGEAGLDIGRSLRGLDPTLPIVFMSGYSATRLPPEVLAEPSTEFLPKPFTLDDLREVSRRLARTPEPATT